MIRLVIQYIYRMTFDVFASYLSILQWTGNIFVITRSNIWFAHHQMNVIAIPKMVRLVCSIPILHMFKITTHSILRAPRISIIIKYALYFSLCTLVHFIIISHLSTNLSHRERVKLNKVSKLDSQSNCRMIFEIQMEKFSSYFILGNIYNIKWHNKHFLKW